MSDNQSNTLLYPSVVLYAVDSIGTPVKAEGGPVRVPIAAPGQTDTPDLVIVTGPLGQPVAKERALQIARRQTDAVLRVAVCEVEVEMTSRDDALTSDLYSSFDAVLAVNEARRDQWIRRLLRTVTVLEAQEQWIACDWNDVCEIARASGGRLVCYGWGQAAGHVSAAQAAAAAMAHIETQGLGLHMARGLCVGIHGASKAVYGREVKEVLQQLRAKIGPSAKVTLAVGCDFSLAEDAIEIDMFAFGECVPTGPIDRDFAGANDVERAVEDACPARDGHDTALDPLYARARALILSHQRASISLIQRHLRIGYGRASRLLDAMEGDILSAKDQDGIRTVGLPAQL